MILEVVWTRVFGLVFGNTVYAISAVVAVFMAGLALGAWSLGRLIDRRGRPLLVFAILEIGIGLWAFMFPTIMRAVEPFYQWFYRACDPSPPVLTFVRVVLTILVLVVPTMLMGGTLPVLAKAFVRRLGDLGREAGLLYGVNTLGALLGCALTGLLLIQWLGVSGTLYSTAALSVGIGLAALALVQVQPRTEPAASPSGSSEDPDKTQDEKRNEKPPESQPDISPQVLRLVLIGYGISGFAALAYEVIWTRLLLYTLTTTIHSFTIMLTAFLLGIALGSVTASRFWTRRSDRLLYRFGLIEILIAATGLMTLPLLAGLYDFDQYLGRLLVPDNFTLVVVKRFLLAATIMFVPAFLLGAAFPIAGRICVNALERLGGGLGRLYAFNVIGGVLGLLVAGFVLLPLLGAERSLILVAGLNLAVGFAVLSCSSERLAQPLGKLSIAAAVAILAAILLIEPPIFKRVLNTGYPQSDLTFYEESPGGTVTVHEYDESTRFVAVDGVGVAGLDLHLRTTQRLQALIPVGLHRDPRRVLQIGFGSGETAHVVRSLDVPEFHVAEIHPAIFRAAAKFRNINHGSYEDPEIRQIICDGKNYARLTGETYDVIMNDSTYPGLSGSSALYTRDHFAACRARLRPGGVLSSRLPLDLRPEDFKMILRSFQDVFPETSVWLALNSRNKHALVLGTTDPFRPDLKQMQALFEKAAARENLEKIHIVSPYGLLSTLVLDPAGVAEVTRGAPLNTDDRPLVEFCASRYRDREKCWHANLLSIIRARRPLTIYFEDVPSTATFPDLAKIGRFWRSSQLLLSGQAADLGRVAGQAAESYDKAREINPDDHFPEACLGELRGALDEAESATKVAPRDPEAFFRLAELYWRLGEYEKCVEAYRKTVQLKTDYVAAHLNLADALVRLDRNDEAVDEYHETLKYNPNLSAAHASLGWIFLKQRQLKDAERHARRAIRLDHERPTNHLLIGRLLGRQAKISEAMAHFETAVRLDPNLPEAYAQIADLQLKTGRLIEALASARTALKLAPQNPDYRALYERIQRILQKPVGDETERGKQP